jgi:hypothetical protein
MQRNGWLVLGKTFSSPCGSCRAALEPETDMPTPGSIIVDVDRLEKKALVKRKNTGNRRVQLAELTPKVRAVITKTFRNTRPRWKRPPASSQKRSASRYCGF